MKDKWLNICLTKIKKELKEPYGTYNEDFEFVPFTWNELANYINTQEGAQLYKDGEALRQACKKERYERGMVKCADDRLSAEKEEIYKERQRLREQNKILKKRLRDEMSIENFEEILNEALSGFDFSSFDTPEKHISHDVSNCSLIVNLSDWHYGLEIDHSWGKYNKDIFLDRINTLTAEVCSLAEAFEPDTIYVNNLNDLISGAIHNSIRAMNSEDTITQIMVVTNTIANMLHKFSEFTNVEYRSTLDNHSRLSAKKSDSWNKENLSRMISFTLEKMFENNTRVNIVPNDKDLDIISFSVYGWNFAAVHGHLDNVSNVVQNISLMTKKYYDAIFMAHRHHFIADEIHGTYVYSNGCLCGSDEYSKDIRATSRPSQNIFVVTPEDPIFFVRTVKF